MTTPTTPAADAVRDTFEQWVASEGGPTTESLLSARSNDDHYKGFIWLRQSLAVFRAATALATARESALIVERDALRDALVRIIAADDAHATIHAPDGDDMARMIEWAEAFDAARALAAPAVEGV